MRGATGASDIAPRPRAVVRLAGVAITLVDCSTYTGRAAPASDAATLDAAPAVDVRVDDTPRDLDLPEAAPWVCGTLDGVCDPFTHAGCAADQRCLVTTLLPPTFACGRPGPRRLGEACDASRAEAACVDGAQCLSGRCLTPCCAGDDASCGARATHSRCAAVTDSARLLGCTIPGECGYAPTDTCGDGAQCFPQSSVGEPVCRAVGSAALGERCERQNECARGLTCVTPAVAFGQCLAVCNPRGLPRCARGNCRAFARSPSDYGYCEP